MTKCNPTTALATPIMKTHARGFTLIELMVVVSIIAILALVAMPSYQGKIIRDQIIEGALLANIAKAPVAARWLASQTMPVDNTAAGLPLAEKIVSTLVTNVAIQDGAVHITFGNQVNGAIKGKTLTLRPAVVDDAPIVPVSWICGHAKTPDKMSAKGQDKTNIPVDYLPSNCRAH